MKENTFKVCALTGHRDLPPDFDRNALYDKLEELAAGGCNSFLCGMAEGFDLLALDCLADLKQRYPLYLEACVPYRGFARRRSPKAIEEYNRLLSWCDRETVLFPSYRKGCYLLRDRYMVDCADVVLAYCKKETGGTAYTVNYARGKGLSVLFV